MVQHAVDGRFMHFHDFQERINDPAFEDAYVFIEPQYGQVLLDGSSFKSGSSQHPLDDVTRGERLLKEIYEAITQLTARGDQPSGRHLRRARRLLRSRRSATCVPPGDRFSPEGNRHGFRFDQLGVRVPAVIVSPHIKRGVIDHTVDDHTSLLATVEHLYGLGPLTKRDATAARFDHLLAANGPRDDAPTRLPEPADSGVPDCEGESLLQQIEDDLEHMPMSWPVSWSRR